MAFDLESFFVPTDSSLAWFMYVDACVRERDRGGRGRGGCEYEHQYLYYIIHKHDIQTSKADSHPPFFPNIQTIIRAEGAQQNGFENLGIFTAGVVAGNAAGLDAGYLNALSTAYVATRVVYTFVYVSNRTRAVAHIRSVVYVGGSLLVMAMFVGAGNEMRRGVV